jgi:hypothetical protein
MNRKNGWDMREIENDDSEESAFEYWQSKVPDKLLSSIQDLVMDTTKEKKESSPYLAFQDPEDKQETKNKINEMRNLSLHELIPFIHNQYPGWIISEHSEYVNELLTVSRRWKQMAQACHTIPQKILLVREIVLPHQDTKGEYTFLNAICDRLTRFGYSIKRARDFEVCKKCKKIASLKITHSCH